MFCCQIDEKRFYEEISIQFSNLWNSHEINQKVNNLCERVFDACVQCLKTLGIVWEKRMTCHIILLTIQLAREKCRLNAIQLFLNFTNTKDVAKVQLKVFVEVQREMRFNKNFITFKSDKSIRIFYFFLHKKFLKKF